MTSLWTGGFLQPVHSDVQPSSRVRRSRPTLPKPMPRLWKARRSSLSPIAWAQQPGLNREPLGVQGPALVTARDLPQVPLPESQ